MVYQINSYVGNKTWSKLRNLIWSKTGSKNSILAFFNPSWPGLPELRQGLGGQICPTIKKFRNKIENHLFQSLPLFALHQDNNCQGWSRKVAQKKVTAEKP